MPELKIIGSIIHVSQKLCFCLRNEKYGSLKTMFKKQLLLACIFSSYKTHFPGHEKESSCQEKGVSMTHIVFKIIPSK